MPMRIGSLILSAYNLPLAATRQRSAIRGRLRARHPGPRGPEPTRSATASRQTAVMRTTFTFRSAGNLLFGRHAVRELGGVLDRIGSKRVFVVTDKVLARVGIVDQVKEAAGRPVEVFDGGEPEPSLGMVQSCIAAAKAFRPDTIVGLGGGSNMDAAKLAAVVIGHGGNVVDYVGEKKVPGPVLPLVCVPTTAGTGSEVSQAAVFTNTDIHLKVSVLSYYLRPTAA